MLFLDLSTMKASHKKGRYLAAWKMSFFKLVYKNHGEGASAHQRRQKAHAQHFNVQLFPKIQFLK